MNSAKTIDQPAVGLGTKGSNVSEIMGYIIEVVKKKNAMEKVIYTTNNQEMLNRYHNLLERASQAVTNIENDWNYIKEHKNVLDEVIETKAPTISLNMPYSQQKNFVAGMECLAKSCNETQQTLLTSTNNTIEQ